jgi:hypothetical protein
MALQTKVRIAFDQHLAVDRAVWNMTNSAAFPHRFVLKDKRPRLFAMALRATLVQAGHRKTAGGFEDVAPMRIMALHTIYPVFNDWMTMRQVELRVRFKVTLKTSGGILAWIDDKNSASPSRRNVFAARAVTRFTPGSAGKLSRLQMDTRMSTAGKMPGDIRMTLGAGFIANVGCPGDFRRRQHGALKRRTGADQNTDHRGTRDQDKPGQATIALQHRPPPSRLWFIDFDELKIPASGNCIVKSLPGAAI